MFRTCMVKLMSGLMLLTAGTVYAAIHDIDVVNFAFQPAGTVVQAGDTVRWHLVSGAHTSTADPSSPKQWNSGTLQSGVPFEVVFSGADGPGPFPYHCAVHPLSMKDTIFVQATVTEPTYFPFLLNEAAANSCDGTGSPARGWGWAVLSADSSSLAVHVEHDVVVPTAAHIHFGAPCVSGGILFPFGDATSPIDETFALTLTDVNNLLAGNLYVNVHSGAFPAGEIRGQIDQLPIQFVFTLDEAQAAGGAGTGSLNSGLAICELSGNGNVLSIDLTHDIPADSVLDGHVHLGAPGVSGGIQFGFSSSLSPISEAWLLDTTDVKNLLAGNLYINIHSSAFPAGEIRGQVGRETLRWAFPLTEGEANGGAGTGGSATGFGVVELNDQLTDVSIYVEHNVVDPIDGHVHLGAPGVSGGIQFGFSSSVSPIVESWAIDDGGLDNLLAGDLYINIHSAAFPSGEIRGQMDHESVEMTFGLDEAQANSCSGTGSSAFGSASILLKAGGRELTIAGSHDVVDPIDAHIHLGAVCVSGGIHFGFTDPASPFAEVWYLDHADLVNLMRQELYVNVHSGAFPSGEIRGQLADLSCCTLRGDFNDNGQIQVSDLTALIAFLFRGDVGPACVAHADVNANGDVQVSDLTLLIAYLFRGGASPAVC